VHPGPGKLTKKRDRVPAEIPGGARDRAKRSTAAVHLRYGYEPREQHGAVLDNPLFQLLGAVVEGGSIRHAAGNLGVSYRYVWGSLRKWERVLGESLITWSQGKRARPTRFAEKLLWSERRARTRMQPHIEALRSELARVLADARDESTQLVAVRASHDIALPILQQHLANQGNLHLDIGFQGSVHALRALNDHECLMAGFHVPILSAAAPIFSRALKPLLKPGLHRLIACSRRMQGLMIRREHATVVHSLPDIARERLRFVNRQPGSGTRMLLDHLMQVHSLVPADLAGYVEHVEQTHVAVALCVASGVVDAGIGVEAAALQFGLHFIPLLEENYFLACLDTNFQQPAVERLREILAGARWREILGTLPGYQPASEPGAVLYVEEALPWWRRTKTDAAYGL
jgi:putative molybdopterin biosynthesis protein